MHAALFLSPKIHIQVIQPSTFNHKERRTTKKKEKKTKILKEGMT